MTVEEEGKQRVEAGKLLRQFEAAPASEERHHELVETDALLFPQSIKVGVHGGGHTNQGLSARLRHLRNSIASGIIMPTTKWGGAATNCPPLTPGGKS